MLFVHLTIHKPKKDKTGALTDSMHRFGDALQGQPGLQQVYTLKDPNTGCLMGLAIWDSHDDYVAARPAMDEAVKDDNFAEWEEEPPTVYHLELA